MRKSFWVFWACFAALGAMAATFPVGSFVYVGVVRDYEGALLGRSDNVIVQAVNSNGVVLGEARVVDLTECGVNFRLAVPMSNVPTNCCATTGEELSCVIKCNGVSYATAMPLPSVGGADDAATCNLVLATDSDGDGVPDQYVDALREWMDYYGIAEYDANADYDGDGVSNYAEYVAGTDPFDKDDFLRVTATAASGGEAENQYFSMSFPYIGGRVYVALSSTNLASGAWAREPFRNSPGDASEYTRFVPENGTDGVKTLYFAPAVDSKFFKIEVNPGDISGDCE